MRIKVYTFINRNCTYNIPANKTHDLQAKGKGM